jgi:hypothetical protein
MFKNTKGRETQANKCFARNGIEYLKKLMKHLKLKIKPIQSWVFA